MNQRIVAGAPAGPAASGSPGRGAMSAPKPRVSDERLATVLAYLDSPERQGYPTPLSQFKAILLDLRDARAELADWHGMMPPGVARPDCVVLSERELDGMRRGLARLQPWREMAEKLDTVLTPMAKGYAREHPVGRNAEMIAETLAALDALRAGEKDGA